MKLGELTGELDVDTVVREGIFIEGMKIVNNGKPFEGYPDDLSDKAYELEVTKDVARSLLKPFLKDYQYRDLKRSFVELGIIPKNFKVDCDCVSKPLEVEVIHLSIDDLYGIYNGLKNLSKDVLQKIKSNDYFYNGDKVDVDEEDLIKEIFSPYALGGSGYAYIKAEGVICYNPKIVGKYISTDNNRNSQLFISECDDLKHRLSVEEVYEFFDKISPCLIGGKSWSNPKRLPKGSEDFLKNIIGNNFKYTSRLYMRNDRPTLRFFFTDYDFDFESHANTEELTEWVVDNFGNNIKEVYIVFNGEKLVGNEVIARKNDDGELTLTIY